eukprot:TRINITY_DN1638_c1_g1_i1.p1 TRINITY_DN1638_c1_g1~~TRINITY_DN1638_c1_g1_i1.p1  ORF type:complete len:692 (+),score=246.86 TRINITY_DN1638_c1_g1_i1:88-2076(+)
MADQEGVAGPDMSDAGMSVVLYLGNCIRYNKKKKGFDRMLIVTRTHVIIAYRGARFAWLGKPEGEIARAVRITQIKDLLWIGGTPGSGAKPRIGLRMRGTGDGQEYDLLFELNDHSATDAVIDVIKKCYGAAMPRPLTVAYEKKDWVMVMPPLNLAKPPKWKPTVPDDLLTMPWNAVQAGHRAHEGPLRGQRAVSIASPLRERTPPSPPRPPEQLPPIPIPPGEDPAEAAQKQAALLSARLTTEPQTLRQEIADLRHQAEAMTRQQKLHMATLDASQRIVSLLVNESCGGYSGFRGRPAIPQVREAAEPSPPPPPPPLGPPPPLRSEQIPPPPVPPMLAVSPARTRSPSPEYAGAGDARVVEALEGELEHIRAEMSHEMDDKDAQIDTLRAALQSVLDENDALRQAEPDAASDSFGDDDGEDWSDEEYWSEPEPEPAPAPTPARAATPRKQQRHVDVVTPDEAEAAQVADTHAQSLQTRRREVEELTRQLDLLDKDRSGRTDPKATAELRRQLQNVLADLELEALAYHDAFTADLPPTQVFHPPPQQASPRRAARASAAAPNLGAFPAPQPPAPAPPPAADGYSPAQYDQWAQYCQYLATYYPSAYAAYYAQSQQAQQPVPHSPPRGRLNHGSTASQYASSHGDHPLHSSPHWQKFTGMPGR